MAGRRAIGKRVRFEVFKRDSFKCQYCGAAAPDVLLQIDHIRPVADGGDNDLLNLVTACVACNAGKSDKPLDDKSAVTKQRAQLEELQERREQLEMLMQWKQGMTALAEDALSETCDYWAARAPGFEVNERGRQSLRKWIRKYSHDEVLEAMNVAADQYLRFKDDGSVTEESWEHAFGKIPGICCVERESAADPEIKDLYYIRGIARNKCPRYFDLPEALELLKAARSWEVTLDELRNIALHTRSWTGFQNDIVAVIARQRSILEPGE